MVLCWLVEQRVPLWALSSNLRLFPHKLSIWPSRGRVSGAEQENSLSKAEVKHHRAWSVTKWIGNYYVLGFALSQRFLWSQILFRSCKSPSDETEIPRMQKDDQMDRWPLRARLCAQPEISLESNTVQILQQPSGWDYKPRFPVCKKMTKRIDDHYVLGFALNQRFVWSQTLCRSYKSSPDETMFQ